MNRSKFRRLCKICMQIKWKFILHIGCFRELALICDGRKTREFKRDLAKESRDKETQGTQSKGRENKSALTRVSHETSKPAHIGHFFHPSIIRLPSKEDIYSKRTFASYRSLPLIVPIYVDHLPTLFLLSMESQRKFRQITKKAY